MVKFPGLSYCLPYISDDIEAFNLNHQQAQTKKLQEKPITVSQRIEKRGNLATETFLAVTSLLQLNTNGEIIPLQLSFTGVQLGGELLFSSYNNKSL